MLSYFSFSFMKKKVYYLCVSKRMKWVGSWVSELWFVSELVLERSEEGGGARE